MTGLNPRKEWCRSSKSGCVLDLPIAVASSGRILYGGTAALLHFAGDWPISELLHSSEGQKHEEVTRVDIDRPPFQKTGMVASAGLALTPFRHQAAGHGLAAQDQPSLLVSEDGSLLKMMQDEVRGGRELQIYACLELSLGSTEFWCQEVRSTLEGGPETVAGTPAIRLQNICEGYEQPSVCDIKIGRTAVYEWAPDEYQRKKRAKEAGSWQQTYGFKVSGMRVWRDGVEQVLDKAACKSRSKDMPAFLKSFADNGQDWGTQGVWKPVQAAVSKMLAWIHSTLPPCWHFYSSSLLVIYEGTAQNSEDLRVRCSLIDFAHTFFAAGRGTNFQEGLQSLLAMLEDITDPDPSHNAENVGRLQVVDMKS